MSFRRQPSYKLERCPCLRMKLLVNDVQVQILSKQQDTILHNLIADFLPWNWTSQHSSTRMKERYPDMASMVLIPLCEGFSKWLTNRSN